MKRACLLFAAILLLVAGCYRSDLPAPSSTPAQSASPSMLVPTPSPATKAAAKTGDAKTGLWQSSTAYGINGSKCMSYTAYLNKMDRYSEPLATDDPDEKAEAAKVALAIGDWTYFFDTKNPIPNGEGFDQYPICRRNKDNVIEDLCITGFEMVATPDYLYVNRNEVSGDFVYWDTVRVSPDGKQMIYVGDTLRLYIPKQGNAMYFSNFGWELYRSDFAMDNVEKLSLYIPDLKQIIKGTDFDSGTSEAIVSNISVGGDWLYFKLEAVNLSGAFYIGKYKMRLSGGKAVKTDRGEYDTFEGE